MWVNNIIAKFLGYLPNGSLAVEAMLATASLGAIWSSTSPDFGALVRLYIDYVSRNMYQNLCSAPFLL